MRIVLTSTYAWPEVRRGGERYLHELGSALAGRGHDVRIVASGPTPGTSNQLGVDVKLLARRNRRNSLAIQTWFGWDAWRHLRRSEFDVWHAFTLGDGAAATLRGGTRAVFTNLGPSAPLNPTPVVGLLHRRILRGADAYLALSRAVQARILESEGVQVQVLGGGVDTTRFRPAAPRDPRPTILFASDVDQRWKNADLLLEACSVLQSEGMDLQVWLTGPGDATNLVRRHPGIAGSVTRASLSTPDELVADYSRAWVTALPSRGEAFGLVALESLACGTPAVALAAEGPADFLDESVGALAAPNVEGLAAALRHALDLSQQTGVIDACCGRARDHDWRDGIAPRLERIYEGGVP